MIISYTLRREIVVQGLPSEAHYIKNLMHIRDFGICREYFMTGISHAQVRGVHNKFVSPFT